MPVKSEAQRRAMYAALEGHSTLGIPKRVAEKFVGPKAHDGAIAAAGVIYLAPSGRVLFIRAAEGGWEFPGGKLEAGEDAESAARREANEEISYAPDEPLIRLLERVSLKGTRFTLFVCRVEGEFQAALSDEHIAWAWAPLDAPPEPLFSEVRATLEELRE